MPIAMACKQASLVYASALTCLLDRAVGAQLFSAWHGWESYGKSLWRGKGKSGKSHRWVLWAIYETMTPNFGVGLHSCCACVRAHTCATLHARVFSLGSFIEFGSLTIKHTHRCSVHSQRKDNVFLWVQTFKKSQKLSLPLGFIEGLWASVPPTSILIPCRFSLHLYWLCPFFLLKRFTPCLN